MSTPGTIEVTSTLQIPESEISYRVSRSGGPGGQHVNTSSTRVELVWDVGTSPSLDPSVRDRLLNKLSNRISSEGLLSVTSSATRSQHRNRADALERFVEILQAALVKPKPRKKTRPSRAAKERRLRAKKKRSEIKKMRRSPPRRDE